jgi:RND family efflux transporter MFP subunit
MKMKKLVLGLVGIQVLLAVSCTGKKDGAQASNTEGDKTAVGMEQLYADNGSPVAVRRLGYEDFSVFLKYPTVLAANSESSAYAMTNDVVRSINFKIGDHVERDQVVLSFSEDNQNLQQAKVAYEGAKSTFDRVNALYANGDVSRQDFDNARTQFELAASRLDAAMDMIYVRSPLSGTITALNVHETENVRSGSPLFTVSNGSGFEARFYVGADEIDQIKTGARVFIDRGSDEISRGLEGRVTQVSLIMDTAKQSFPATAFFPRSEDGARHLVSGMGVDLAVETYRNEEALVVSRRELIKNDSGYTAYIAVDNTARPVNVQIGHIQGLRYEIIGGLQERDFLISEGQQRLEAGTQINLVTELAFAGSSVSADTR